MSKKKQIISEYIQTLLKKRQQPRNQIAAISGLTNTYIKDLEAGNFINVRREKLISLSIALDLSLEEIDKLLDLFDRKQLTIDDIDVFIELSKKGKISSAILPLNSNAAPGPLLSLENSPGPYIIVSPEPTHSLMKKGYGSFAKMSATSNHLLYEEFMEAFNHERYKMFLRNLAIFSMEQYICHDCLEQYAKRYSDSLEREFRIQHLKNVIDCLINYKNFKLFLLDICPRTSFLLKLAQNPTTETDKLVFYFWPQHRLKLIRSGNLKGFTTNHSTMVQTFKDELQLIQKTVIDKFLDQEKLISYLRSFLS